MMSVMKRCKVCGELGLFDCEFLAHACKPIFYYKHEDWGDEFVKIRAYNFEDAATRFAEYYDGDDHALVDDSDGVEVIISDGTTEKKFLVFAEPTIDYTANCVEDE